MAPGKCRAKKADFRQHLRRTGLFNSGARSLSSPRLSRRPVKPLLSPQHPDCTLLLASISGYAITIAFAPDRSSIVTLSSLRLLRRTAGGRLNRIGNPLHKANFLLAIL